MDQFTAEKRLTYTYLFASILGAITSITSGIAWGHWKGTLDQCIGRNCSCILYGEYTPSKFLGGSNGGCIWITFGPLIYLLFTISMCCFHGYRVLFTAQSPTTRSTRTVTAKYGPDETVQVHAISEETTSPLSTAYWIIVSTLSIIFSLYALAHFAIFLDGFYKTCNQYRLVIERIIRFDGSAIAVIHGRLPCQAIYDFMDYIQQDTSEAYREGYINTGLDLTLGIVASFFSWILFANAAFLNIKMVQWNKRQ